MRIGNYRTSKNVGEAGSAGLGGFGGGRGGGIFGLIFGLVASRFGIAGIIVLVVGAMLLGFNPFGGGANYATQQPAETSPATAAESCEASADRRLTCQVLASTEDVWSRQFANAGQQYEPANLRFYDRSGASGCGTAQSAMGPFYCPTDQGIYLDTEFYDQLESRIGAGGDFAQAYVIAHEVGHHIQGMTGVLDQARAAQQRVSRTEGNAIQVRVELQADCYAGVWGNLARSADGRALIEPGDIEEGLTAAHQIGDDTLMRSAGQSVQESMFTHGTSEQRTTWLRRGLETGDYRACDTFASQV